MSECEREREREGERERERERKEREKRRGVRGRKHTRDRKESVGTNVV